MSVKKYLNVKVMVPKIFLMVETANITSDIFSNGEKDAIYNGSIIQFERKCFVFKAPS